MTLKSTPGRRSTWEHLGMSPMVTAGRFSLPRLPPGLLPAWALVSDLKAANPLLSSMQDALGREEGGPGLRSQEVPVTPWRGRHALSPVRGQAHWRASISVSYLDEGEVELANDDDNS